VTPPPPVKGHDVVETPRGSITAQQREAAWGFPQGFARVAGSRPAILGVRASSIGPAGIRKAHIIIIIISPSIQVRIC
jgi:hypothetical protein